MVPQTTQAAAALTHERLLKLRSFWRPCFEPFRPGMSPRTYTPRSWADEEPSTSASQQQPNMQYSGIGYVAQWGRYWELPCGGVARVRAAQLQHRLPCWGYVIEELLPAPKETHKDKRLSAHMVVSIANHHHTGGGGNELSQTWASTPNMDVEVHEGKRLGRKVSVFACSVIVDLLLFLPRVFL
jgi:hypothetical protein